MSEETVINENEVVRQEMLENYLADLRTEEAGLDAYIEFYYKRKVAEPLPPSTEDKSYWKIAGLEFILHGISSIGAVVFSSIRTGGVFYVMEQLLLNEYNLAGALGSGLSASAMISALFAFEFGLLAVGFSSGRRSHAIQISQVSMWLSMAVIILMGIFTGKGLITVADGLQNGYTFLVVLISSIAVGWLTHQGGKNIGWIYTYVEKKRQELDDSYIEAMAQYRESALASYNSNKLGRKKMSGVQSSVQSEQENEQSVQSGVHFRDEHPVQDEPNSLENAIEFTGAFIRSEHRLPTVTEVELGTPVSRGWASQAINKFVSTYAGFIGKHGMATPDRITAAIEKFPDLAYTGDKEEDIPADMKQ